MIGCLFICVPIIFFVKKVYLLYPCLALMSHNHEMFIFDKTIPNSSQLNSVVSNDNTTTTLYNVAKKSPNFLITGSKKHYHQGETFVCFTKFKCKFCLTLLLEHKNGTISEARRPRLVTTK